MPRADRVPFLAGRRLLTIRARLDDQLVVDLVVDSGAERSVISRDAAQSLGLGPPLRTQILVGVGRSPSVPVMRLGQLRVGTNMTRGLEVFVYDLPALLAADGLLGLDFLRRFRLTFDFEAGVLILREPRRP
jgi:predicted aspartyl protease